MVLLGIKGHWLILVPFLYLGVRLKGSSFLYIRIKRGDYNGK